jgi:hypothetical protein
MKNIPVSIFIIFTSILVFNSCKKPNEIEENKTQMANNKWAFVPYDFFTHSSYFFEDRDGNVAYKNRQSLYLFNDKGILQVEQPLSIPNNESVGFNFRRDGGTFFKQSPFNSMSSDFIFYQKRLGPFAYSDPTMLDIRKVDSSGNYISEYYIHAIFPNNLANSSSSSGWVFASRYPDINSLYFNRNAQPVMIPLSQSNVGSEYELPKDIIYHSASSNATHVCLYAPNTSKTITLDRFMKLVGTQQTNDLVPDINVLGSFVMRAADGYYLSDNAIQLKEKIPGLSNEAQIFHGSDSLLHIYNNGSYSTINAITGAEVFKLDTKSEKMPINIDTVNTHDYYRTSKGVGYLITSRGIIVIN